MEKGLGHLFISSRSFQFFNKTDFEQCFFSVGSIPIRSKNYIPRFVTDESMHSAVFIHFWLFWLIYICFEIFQLVLAMTFLISSLIKFEDDASGMCLGD